MFHEDLIQGIDALNARIGATQRALLGQLAAADAAEVWTDSGARDMPHWVTMRYGISYWKALRWIAAGRALEGLPRLARALASGELSLDKVVELARFATVQTVEGLIGWAQSVSVGAIRHRGDVEPRREREEAAEVEGARRLESWFFDQGRRYGLYLEAPAAAGAVIDRAIDRAIAELPVMPGEGGEGGIHARRADALVALASSRLAADADADRATVVIHAPPEALTSGEAGAELEGGGVVHPETVRRLLCTSRVQAVIEDRSGTPVAFGKMSRVPSVAMMRQLRWRDRECRFTACGSRRFLQAHHIVWRARGGGDELDNQILICSFHHRLVHELGWKVERDPDGTVRWFRPDGTRYRAGPEPSIEEEWTPPLIRLGRTPGLEARAAPSEAAS